MSFGMEFIASKYGKKALDGYLAQATKVIYRDLIAEIRKRGVKALSEYWKKMYSYEGADFNLRETGKGVELKIKKCPAIAHMRKFKYKIYKDYCRHTKIVNDTLAKVTGYKSEVVSCQKRGSCVQRFYK